MVKKKIYSALFSVLFLLSVFAVCFSFLGSQIAYAADEETGMPERDEEVKLGVHFDDEYLYSLLLNMYCQDQIAAGGTASIHFPAGAFSDYTELDLSTTENADVKIKSLAGLEYLYFDSLKTFNINNNLIEEITKDQLIAMPFLTSLSAQNNLISSIEIPTSSKISYLNLYNNNIANIDLVGIKKSADASYTIDRAYVNLKLNNFDNKTNLILPTAINCPVDLYLAFNNIFNISSTDYEGHNVYLGVQGYNPTKEFIEGDKILIARDDLYNDLTVKQVYQTISDINPDDIVDLVASEIEGDVLTLVAGKTIIVFYDDATEITDGVYKRLEVGVKPKAPTFKIFNSEGEELPYISTGKYDGNCSIQAFSDTVGGVIYVGFENGQMGNAGEDIVLLKESGNYYVTSQVVYDGVYSHKTTIFVNIKGDSGAGTVLIIVASIIILGIAIYYLVRWYRQGAIVAPLSDKEQARMNKPKRR